MRIGEPSATNSPEDLQSLIIRPTLVPMYTVPGALCETLFYTAWGYALFSPSLALHSNPAIFFMVKQLKVGLANLDVYRRRLLLHKSDSTISAKSLSPLPSWLSSTTFSQAINTSASAVMIPTQALSLQTTLNLSQTRNGLVDSVQTASTRYSIADPSAISSKG